jgi:uncharacterized protein YwqG
MQKVLELIKSSPLSDRAEYLQPLLAPSIRIKRTPRQQVPLHTGASKIGGIPDLPPMLEWPRWNGRALAFLAQLHLPTVAEYAVEGMLPKSGMLYFFYDADEQPWGFDPQDTGGGKVFYFDGPLETLASLQLPDDIPDYNYFPPQFVEFFSEWTLPDWSSDLVAPLNLTSAEREAWFNLNEKIRCSYGESSTFHRMLGHPDAIQCSDMELECQLASNGIYVGGPEGYQSAEAQALKYGATDWRLLLQLDSDWNTETLIQATTVGKAQTEFLAPCSLPSDEIFEMMWGDSGRLYFWIRKQDLEAKVFDKTWTVLQCY